MERLLVTLLSLGVGLVLWIFIKRLRNLPPLPPGPPADPIIGHLRIIPTDNNDLFFYELSKKYGEHRKSIHPSPAISNCNAGKVAHLRIPGNTMIILNSVQAATDLLDKRSAIYSDRAQSDVFMLYAILFYLPPPKVIFVTFVAWAGKTMWAFFHTGNAIRNTARCLMNTSVEKNVKTTFPTKLWRPLDSSKTFFPNQKNLTTI